MTTDDPSRPGPPPGPGQPAVSASPDPAASPSSPPPSSPPPSSPPPTRPSARRPAHPKKSFLRELPGIVVTALVISVLIKTFLVQAFYIPSGSMENTLLVNDRVLVNKLVDKPDEVRRGDVVVFRDPGGWLAGQGEGSGRDGVMGAVRDALVFVGLAPAVGEEDLIKRVIGVGGDEVACCDEQDRLTVNGVPLDEPYVFPGDSAADSKFDVTVPQGKIWVMGDHRSVSEDSRAHRQQPGNGFVPVDDVIGRAFTIVWPLDRTRLLRRSGTLATPAVDASAR